MLGEYVCAEIELVTVNVCEYELLKITRATDAELITTCAGGGGGGGVGETRVDAIAVPMSPKKSKGATVDVNAKTRNNLAI